MTTQDQLDKLANEYNKTKDPRYKEAWYRKIKEVAYGTNSIDRWNISSGRGDKRNDTRD